MMYRRQFAGQSFNVDDQLWGEKPVDVPVAVVHQALRAVLQKIAFATY
jgi:hypothetical protein